MAAKAVELAGLEELKKAGQLDAVGAVRMEQLAAEIALYRQQVAAQEELLKQQQQMMLPVQ